MAKLVRLENIEPGMIIDQDVKNPQGAVLLKAGNEVTERHISIFKTWGVNSLFVKEEISSDELGDRTPTEAAEELIQTEENRLEQLFSVYVDNEVMQAIKSAALKYKTGAIKRKYNVS